jgi:hypothetical protein
MMPEEETRRAMEATMKEELVLNAYHYNRGLIIKSAAMRTPRLR